jgi:hypothetical protein
MRTWIFLPVLACALMAVGVPGATAREMEGRGGPHMWQINGVTSRQPNIDRRRRGQRRFGPLVPFGFAGEFTGFENPNFAVPGQPDSEFSPYWPVRAQLDANQPPCHETTPEGVVILRGKGCSRSAR